MGVARSPQKQSTASSSVTITNENWVCHFCKIICDEESDSFECSSCEHFVHYACTDPQFASLMDNASNRDEILEILSANCVSLTCSKCSQSSPTSKSNSATQTSVAVSNSFAQTQNRPPQHVVLDDSQSDLDSILATQEPNPVPIRLKDTLSHGKDDPTSNFFMFDFHFENEQFKSTEHCYLSKICLPFDANLARQIKEAEHAGLAKELSKRIPKPPPGSPEWENRVKLMRQILRSKLHQCKQFRDALRKSNGTRIVHSTYESDKFWASGLHFRAIIPRDLPGKNWFGVLLTEMRDTYLMDEPRYRYTGGPSKQSSKRPWGSVMCYHCGVPNHTANDCELKRVAVYCRRCSALGHKERYCHMHQNGIAFRPPPQQQRTMTAQRQRSLLGDFIPRHDPSFYGSNQSMHCSVRERVNHLPNRFVYNSNDFPPIVQNCA